MADEPEGAERTPPVVLIVEDEEPIAQALAIIVEDFGLTPVVALHGKQAIELLREHQPALIITDLMMPHMTGTQLIAAVRADVATSGTPIVVMSAAGIEHVREAEADAILPKPFSIRQVEDLLRRFVSRLETG